MISSSIYLSPSAVPGWLLPVFVWGHLSLFVRGVSAILVTGFRPVFPRGLLSVPVRWLLPVLVRRIPLSQRRSAMRIIVIGNIRRIAISPGRLLERRSIRSLLGRVECWVSIPPIVPSPRKCLGASAI